MHFQLPYDSAGSADGLCAATRQLTVADAQAGADLARTRNLPLVALCCDLVARVHAGREALVPAAAREDLTRGLAVEGVLNLGAVMGDAAWIILIIFGSLILLYAISALVFPDETRSKLRLLHKASLTTEGISLEFLSEAVREKEKRQPDSAELEVLLRNLPRPRNLLWVDDNPQNNINEVQALRAAGLGVDIATTNSEAFTLASHRNYDAVISDIKRNPPESMTAGLELGRELEDIARGRSENLPIVYYVGRVEQDHTPDGWPVTDTPTGLMEALGESLTSQAGAR